MRRMKAKLTNSTAATLVAKAAQGGFASAFVGAGISRAAPSLLPSWAQFRDAVLEAMVSRLVISGLCDAKDAPQVLRDLKQESVAQRAWLKPEVVLQWLHPHVRTTLAHCMSVFADAEPNGNHYTLADLALQHNLRVGTCNFDTTIEQALMARGAGLKAFAGTRSSGACGSFREYLDLDWGAPHVVPVLKVHGCVSAFSTVQATLEQVSRPKSPSAKGAMSSLFAGRFVLVAGYSGRDDLFPLIESASQSSRGVLWVNLDKESLNPRVLRHRAIQVLIGDADQLFSSIGQRIGSPRFRKPELVRCLALGESLQDSVKGARPLPTALGLASLAMHLGATRAVDYLCEDILAWPAAKPEHRVQALLARGDTYRRSDPKRSMRSFVDAERAASPIRSKHPLLYARVLAYLADQHFLRGSKRALQQALQLNARSSRWARKGKGNHLILLNMETRASVLAHLGQVEQARRVRMDCVRRLKQEGDLISLAHAYNNLGNDCQDLGLLREAVAWWRQSLALKEEHTSDYPSIGRTRFNIGNVLRETGEYKAAIRELRRSLQEAQVVHDDVTAVRCRYALAAAAGATGKKRQALQLLQRAEKEVAEMPGGLRDSSKARWAARLAAGVRAAPIS